MFFNSLYNLFVFLYLHHALSSLVHWLKLDFPLAIGGTRVEKKWSKVQQPVSLDTGDNPVWFDNDLVAL